jgi:tetratricopeptide (TPR) repeat protein
MIFFWNEWRKSYRYLYTFGLIVFFSLIVYLAYSTFLGENNMLYWTVDGQLDILKIPLASFNQLLYNFNLQVDSYLLTETFRPSFIDLNFVASQIYFVALVIGSIFLLTVMSDLGRIWYAIAIGMFIFFLANLKLELLGIFHNIHEKSFLIFCIIAYVPLTYYYHSFSKDVHHGLRFLIFTIITAFVIGIGAYFTQNPQPIFTIVHHGFVLPVIFSLLFILLNSSEIVRGILKVTTTGRLAGSGNTRHFIILSLIYLFNLAYFIAKTAYGVNWGIIYIHPFYIVILSSIIGIWGFMKREEQYGDMMLFAPTGAFLYIGLGIITLSTISFTLQEVNDSWIEVFEDGVAFSHLAWGLMLLSYVLVNFLDPLLQNLPVHKILYKPRNMDYTSAWLGGLVIISALCFRSGFFQYQQSFAGYFIGLAEVSRAEKDIYTTKQYLGLASVYDVRSFRANYTLGCLAREAKERDAAKLFFEDAIQRRNVPYAYAHLAELHLQENRYFDAIFQLRTGLEKCPESGELANNLALLYNQHTYGDSAYIYFDYAKRKTKFSQIPESNTYALLAKYDFPDTLYKQINDLAKDKNYVGFASNELAYLNKQGVVSDKPFNNSLLPDSTLNTPQLCYLFNYALNKVKNADDDLIKKLEYYSKVSTNIDFRVFLEYALALIYYEKQNYKEAFILLNRVIRQGNLMNPDYPNLMGKWLLQQEEYQLAVQFFEETYRRGEGEGMINKAIALSELPEKNLALEAWDNVKKINRAEEYLLAIEMLTLLSKDSSMNLPVEENIPDVQKFRFLHYRPNLSDTDYEKVFTSIKDTRFQTVLLSEKVKTFLQNKDLLKAESYHQRLIQLPKTEDVKPYLDLATLDLLVAKNKLDDEYLKMLENATFPTNLIGKKYYYEGIFHSNKDSLKTVNAYEQALRLLPTNVEVYKGYANFYNRKGDTDKAYNILLSGLEIQPKSISLLKAYTLQCVESGYTTYVDFGLQDLSMLVNEEELERFKKELSLKKEEVKRKNQEKWGVWE